MADTREVAIISSLIVEITTDFYYCSVLPTPPPPSKPVTYANYDIQLPAVGEEFFFAIYTYA